MNVDCPTMQFYGSCCNFVILAMYCILGSEVLYWLFGKFIGQCHYTNTQHMQY